MKINIILICFSLMIVCVLSQSGVENKSKIDCTRPNYFEYGCGNCTIQDNNPYADCGGYDQGICIDELCQCEDDYYGPNCQNERKDKLTAFLITLLVGPPIGIPPGAGRIYLGYKDIGAAQLILGLAWTVLFFPVSCVINMCCIKCFCYWNIMYKFNI